jgi:hypothetical protein
MTEAPAPPGHVRGTVPDLWKGRRLRSRQKADTSARAAQRGQSPRHVLVGLLLALALAAPSAGAALPRVVAVPGFQLAQVGDLAEFGAVGLVVPDAGPTTSQARAVASLERGEVVNSLRGEPPSGEPLVDVDFLTVRLAPPPAPVALGIPDGGTQANDRRYLIFMRGRQGVLTSDSTRIPGIVSIADVATGRLEVVASDDPVTELRELDQRIRDNGQSRPIAGVVIAALIAALAFVRPRAAVLGFATAAATNLVLGVAGISEPWLVVALLALGTFAALPLAHILRSPVALGAVLAGAIAAYLVAMAADTSWVALSPLGPTQNARFYGLSNLLETLLLVPALGAAALLGRRFGWKALAAVALLCLVTVAGSRFGADGGGAIVLAAGFAVVGVTLAGGGRRATALALAGGAAAVALIAADALVGPTTHVGESLRDGPDELARDFWERLELSWERTTDSAGVALAVLTALALLAVLAARGARRPLPLAVLAAIAVSLLVNDSPKEVAIGGLVSYLAAERFSRTGQAGPAGYTGSVTSRS